MKKFLAAIGTLLTTAGLFLWKTAIAPSATEIVKSDLKPIVVKMLKEQLDKSSLLKSDDNKLAENLGDQLLEKNKADLSCKEGETEQTCQARLLEVSGFNSLQQKLDAFNDRYERCYDDVVRSPYIDLDNHTEKYHETIKCMIVHNQGEMLDSVAESEPHLAKTIYLVKQSIFPAYR